MYEGSRGCCTCAIFHQLASSRISVGIVFVVDPSTVASYWLLQSTWTQEQREIRIALEDQQYHQQSSSRTPERGSTSSSAAPVLNASDTATTPKSVVTLHLSRLEQTTPGVNSPQPQLLNALFCEQLDTNYAVHELPGPSGLQPDECHLINQALLRSYTIITRNLAIRFEGW